MRPDNGGSPDSCTGESRNAGLDNRALQEDMKDKLPPMLSCWVFDHIIDSAKNFVRFALNKERSVVTI